jgi:leader peptidase (prepilin peptidase)/N-methyltransferase
MMVQIVMVERIYPLERFFVSMLAGSAALYVIALISRGGMGMGDVKLVGLLGGITGLLGYRYLFLMLLSAFALGSIYGIALIVTNRASRKSSVPFGPFIGGGYLLSQLAYHFIPHVLGL